MQKQNAGPIQASVALRYFRRNTLLLPLQEQYKPHSPSSVPHIHMNVSSQTEMSITREQRIPQITTAPRTTTFWQFFRATNQETKTSIAGDLILNHSIPPIIGPPATASLLSPQDFTKLQRPRIDNLTQLELKESTQDPIPSNHTIGRNSLHPNQYRIAPHKALPRSQPRKRPRNPETEEP